MTGHDTQGKAIVVEDGPLHKLVPIEKIPRTVFHEIWSTEGAPAIVGNGPDPTLGPLALPSPRQGTCIRVVDMPPDTEEFLEHGSARMKNAFTQIGDPAASTVRAGSPHPLMHRTESIDFGIVLDGEMTLVLDDSEIALDPGDVVVQRGTNHAWANRSGRMCRTLFVLVGGQYEAGLPAVLGQAGR